jgi:mannose-6-phosphate isomerase-like protein (cupin superfamily)
MRTFQLSDLLSKIEHNHRPWLEFLRAASLSTGVYHLKAGQADPQQPHTEDEVYYVVSGRASFRADAEQISVGPGSLIYVERNLKHRFFDIAEDLTLLVFFAPPEGSLKKD